MVHRRTEHIQPFSPSPVHKPAQEALGIVIGRDFCFFVGNESENAPPVLTWHLIKKALVPQITLGRGIPRVMNCTTEVGLQALEEGGIAPLVEWKVKWGEGEVEVMSIQVLPTNGKRSVKKSTLLSPCTLIFPFRIWLCTQRHAEDGRWDT